MTPDQMTLLTAILTTVLGGGGLGAYVLYRAQKKKEPIDAETAAVINARTAGEMALAVAKQQGETIKQQGETIAAMQVEMATLKSTLGGVITWIRNLFANWDTVRQESQPPSGLPPGVL